MNEKEQLPREATPAELALMKRQGDALQRYQEEAPF